MLRTYLLLRPAPNSLEALVEYYKNRDVLGAAVPYGLRTGEVAHPAEHADTLAVVSVWPSQEAYDSWLAAPERQALIEDMRTLLDGPDAITGWSTAADEAAAADFTVLYGNRPVSVRLRTPAASALDEAVGIAGPHAA